MKKIRHLFEYLFAFVLVMVLIFTIASVFVVKYHGSELKEFAMKTINEQVDTKIQLGDVGISVLKEFPYTSVFFTDVVVWSGHDFERNDFRNDNRDTLFSSGYIALRFNPFDLVRKKFSVKSLTATDGNLNLLTDKAGGVNYTLRRGSKAPATQTPLVELRKVNLKDIRIHLVNLSKSQEGRFLVRDMDVSGNFSSSNYQMDLSGNAVIRSWRVSGIEYFSNQQLESDISVNVTDQTYHIEQGNLNLGFIVAAVYGSVMNVGEQGAELNLELEARKVDLPWLLDLVLKNSESQLDQIRLKGNADFNASVTGRASSTISPHLEADFLLNSSSLAADFIPVPIRAIRLEGRFSNGEQNSMYTGSLDLHTLNFSILSGDIRSSIQISNLVEPVYRIQARGDIPVTELREFFPQLPVQFSSGMIHPDVSISGRITGLREGEAEFSLFPGGKVSISGISGNAGDGQLPFSNLTGTLNMGYQQWGSSFSGDVAGSGFELEMEHNNPIPFIKGEGILNVYTRFRSPVLNLDRMIPGEERHGKEKNRSWPDKLTLAFDAEIEELLYRNATLSSIKTSGGYAYPSLFIEKFSANGWNGRISASALLDQLDKETRTLTLESDAEDVEIGALFQTFNNFGQQELTHQHIRGNLTATTALSADIGNDNKLILPTIVSNNDIMVRQGELINFKPLIKISNLLRIEKMDRVAFSTLENSILISDNTITIPEMEIRSNALNVNASGKQQLNGNYTYHLAVKLSEILFSKARHSANREFEVALDEEDKRTVFLVVYDDGNGMNVDFDEAQAMKKIRSDLKAERQELKEIFRQEFGKPGQVDTAQRETGKDVPLMRFEFPDEQADSLPEIQPEKKRKWWQRKEDKKEELDFVIDDSDG